MNVALSLVMLRSELVLFLGDFFVLNMYCLCN